MLRAPRFVLPWADQAEYSTPGSTGPTKEDPTTGTAAEGFLLNTANVSAQNGNALFNAASRSVDWTLDLPFLPRVEIPVAALGGFVSDTVGSQVFAITPAGLSYLNTTDSDTPYRIGLSSLSTAVDRTLQACVGIHPACNGVLLQFNDAGDTRIQFVREIPSLAGSPATLVAPNWAEPWDLRVAGVGDDLVIFAFANTVGHADVITYVPSTDTFTGISPGVVAIGIAALSVAADGSILLVYIVSGGDHYCVVRSGAGVWGPSFACPWDSTAVRAVGAGERHLWTAVLADATIWTSDNGTAWTQQSPDSPTQLNGTTAGAVSGDSVVIQASFATGCDGTWITHDFGANWRVYPNDFRRFVDAGGVLVYSCTGGIAISGQIRDVPIFS